MRQLLIPAAYEHTSTRDGEKIDFFNFLSIRLALLIIDKKLHLSIKNRFCPELQKSQYNLDFFVRNSILDNLNKHRMMQMWMTNMENNFFRTQ